MAGADFEDRRRREKGVDTGQDRAIPLDVGTAPTARPLLARMTPIVVVVVDLIVLDRSHPSLRSAVATTTAQEGVQTPRTFCRHSSSPAISSSGESGACARSRHNASLQPS